jgi:hypothetical protein
MKLTFQTKGGRIVEVQAERSKSAEERCMEQLLGHIQFHALDQVSILNAPFLRPKRTAKLQTFCDAKTGAMYQMDGYGAYRKRPAPTEAKPAPEYGEWQSHY